LAFGFCGTTENGGLVLKISETQKTEHELLCVIWQGIDEKDHETWVDIHKNSEGELLDVSVGNKEISAFDLDILDFLRKEGKL